MEPVKSLPCPCPMLNTTPSCSTDVLSLSQSSSSQYKSSSLIPFLEPPTINTIYHVAAENTDFTRFMGPNALGLPECLPCPFSFNIPMHNSYNNSDVSTLSSIEYSNASPSGQKIHANNVHKFERMQQRKIKNRESAARSRARKQEYTIGLEIQVAQQKRKMEEMQEKLRKQDELIKRLTQKDSDVNLAEESKYKGSEEEMLEKCRQKDSQKEFLENSRQNEEMAKRLKQEG